MNKNIIYHDNDVTIINKPSGIIVNEATSVTGDTIQAWQAQRLVSEPETEWQSLIPADFSAEYGSPIDILKQRGGIVHRLDKNTSGVLVLANNPGSLVNLLQQFRLRQTEKEYLCLAHGKITPAAGNIDLPLSRGSFNRQKFTVDPEGRNAVTEYTVAQFFAKLLTDELGDSVTKEDVRTMAKVYQGFSLVACRPKTGRTHQIRVHMAAIQHPLVGDVVYVGRKRAKLDPLWCPRQFLHAAKLSFIHPRTGEKVTFEAPLAEDLKQVLHKLES